MKNKSRAFTLIELLVVVLIIGILAAIAVPQYQKAVWKSRNVQLKSLIRTVVEAEQAYFMANGKYAANFNELDIDLPLTAVQTQGTSTSYEVNTSSCQLAVMGTDSIRRGKNFEIVLNATDLSSLSVAGAWTEDVYECTGFRIPASTGILKCIERAAIEAGVFCNKLEGATLSSEDKNWRYYKY